MCCFLIAVSGPPVRGIGAKRMRGHSGKSAAPREKQLCGPEALLVAVLDVRLRLGFRLPPALLRGGALIWPHFRSVERADGLFSLISLAILVVPRRLVHDVRWHD